MGLAISANQGVSNVPLRMRSFTTEEPSATNRVKSQQSSMAAGEAISKASALPNSARSKSNAAVAELDVQVQLDRDKIQKDYTNFRSTRESYKSVDDQLAKLYEIDVNYEKARNAIYANIPKMETPDTAKSTIRDTDFSVPAQSVRPPMSAQRANIYAANAQPQQPVLSLLA